MFMAWDVTYRAPQPVKIAYVTYKMERAWTVDLEYMAATVIYRVQSTVMTIHVTCRMVLASPVNLDGLEYIVYQVMLLIAYNKRISYQFLYVFFVIVNSYQYFQK